MEWWPEYDIPIGKARESAGTDIHRLYDQNVGVYRRRFSHGEVLVNPTSPYDDTGKSVTVRLDRPMRLARTRGGGIVPTSGRKPGKVTYKTVRQGTLPPYSAAVLLK